MELSIIIVNWNTKEMLRECLTSIDAYTKGAEIIVVDNASGDGSAAMVQDNFPQVKVIENNSNVGYASANNQAIQKSSSRFVLLLNSDATLTHGAVDELIKPMDDDQGVGICGPRLIYPDGREQLSHGKLPGLWEEIISLFGVIKKDRNGQPAQRINSSSDVGAIATGMVNGASMMVRRELFNTIGLLDDRFFMFNEEVDFCKRAREAGWKVAYVPRAVVIHIGGGSTGLTPERVLRLYRGKLQYFDKHHGTCKREILHAAMWVSTWLKAGMYLILGLFQAEKQTRGQLWLAVGKSLHKIQI